MNFSRVIGNIRAAPPVESGRMSPPSGDVPQTPESKSSSGLAGVIKTLTRVSRTQLAASSSSLDVSTAPADAILSGSLNGGGSLHGESYGGPLHFEQLYEQIQPRNPLAQRVAAAEALRHVVQDFSLNSIMGIWVAAKDLTDPDLQADARHAGFALLNACINHADPTPLERRQFFETLAAPCNPDDFHLQLTAMVELTKHGKNVDAFEIVMLPLLTRWLSQWFRLSAVARKKEKDKEKDKGSTTRANGMLGEETNLDQLFTFVNDVIRFNFNAFQEDEVLSLLDQVLLICKRTTSGHDIKNSVSIIDALITYGDLPRDRLETSLEILCGAHSTLKDLVDPTWNAISNLCKSHFAQTTLTTVLNIIRSPLTPGWNTNTVRGAILVTDRIMRANGSGGFPTVPLSQVIDAFSDSLVANSARLELEIIDTIASTFENSELRELMLQEDDWTTLLDLVLRCAQRVPPPQSETRSNPTTPVSPLASGSKIAKEREMNAKLAQSLARFIVQLENICAIADLTQKRSIMLFFFAAHVLLPDGCAQLLIQYYDEEHLCYPSDPDWLTNLQQLIDVFFRDPARPSSVRMPILQVTKDVYEIAVEMFPHGTISSLVTPIFESIVAEREIEVLEDTVAFAVQVARTGSLEHFDVVLQSVKSCMLSEDPVPASLSPSSPRPKSGVSPVSRPASSATGPVSATSPATIVAAGIVRMFLQSVNTNPTKASKTFELLLDIAKSAQCETSARLVAMKLLFRIRSDWAHSILVVYSTECDEIAASLHRTIDSFANRRPSEEKPQHRMSSDEPQSTRSSRGTSIGHWQPGSSRGYGGRSTSGTPRPAKQFTPLWMYPDPAALPENPPTEASQVVFSSLAELPIEPPENGLAEKLVLRLNVWLEVLISMLQKGGDWELCSFVLVHLGPQLTNHSLFAGALPQIKMLRSVLCEQLKATSFHEPPLASGLKKADVTVCLFHILTMLVSYHEHYSKNEQDEIVRTFISGVGSWERTSNCCIHALAICCHELPLSVSKSLNTILQKMSQIITQSHVAVHILEFLGGLARMPEVYINFREEDFRIVFGICFRYLQSVRDQRPRASTSAPPSTRTSMASTRQSHIVRDSLSSGETYVSPSTSEELPQYVNALAYHVLTFWFMSLKLMDRSRYISWITRNLFSADGSGKESVDELSLVTIDMMQRVTYSDHDETLPDAQFAKPSDGAVAKRSWITGSSILTIETAVGSGVSQLTMRQPSATTYSTYRSLVAQRPLHQIPLASHSGTDGHDESSRVTVLPNHILLQLAACSSRLPESARPIPLPDDDMTTRALSTFDRNSTVDGHKVGIIYVGESQKTEAEILQNVTGSSDYTAFLEGLGTLVKLKGAKFNTQGLDRENDMDGVFAYCWRDRVTEIVFHATTMMPTDIEHDPQCINKKRHTGNDFVNIIFNDSGGPFSFDTFPSDFNYVNIVITPESRASFVASRLRSTDFNKQFYRVQVLSKPGFPEISPAAETKIISGKSLPAFARLIALNASVFSLVWSNREGGEYISSWRNRLRQINKLREKHSSDRAPGTSTPTNGPVPPSSSGSGIGPGGVQRDLRRASTATFLSEGLGSHRSSMLSTATTATEGTEPGAAGEVDGLADE